MNDTHTSAIPPSRRRVAVIGFLHESNTFASVPTTLQDFRSATFARGDEMFGQWGDSHHEIGGMLGGARREALDIVPVLGTWGTPGGVVERDAYEAIWGTIASGLESAGRVDGILLALHGSMVAAHLDSADGETCARLRRLVGPDMPIVMTLDMHANISRPMIANTDATICYRTYPHVDQRQVGVEAAALMARVFRDGSRPRQCCIKLPMLIHIARQYTGGGAMKVLMRKVAELGQRPGVLSCSLAPGYIYADVPHMGVSVVCVAQDSDSVAHETADEIARLALELREELNTILPEVPAAIALAARTASTTILMDCGDNIGAGGPGDSTVLFHAAADAGLVPLCGILHDPEAVVRCHEAGQGAKVSLVVGGRISAEVAPPLAIEGTVRTLHDGKFVEMEPRHGGHRFLDQGSTAVVEMADGSLIVLDSLRIMPTSLAQLTALGIDPTRMRVLIVKGATAPLAAYGPLGEVIQVDSEGVTRAGPEGFAYEKRPKPIFPLDDFEPTPGLALRFP